MSEDVQVRKGDLVGGNEPGPLHIVKRCEGDECDTYCGVAFRGYDSIDRYFVGREHNRQRFEVCQACYDAERPSAWERLLEPF